MKCVLLTDNVRSQFRRLRLSRTHGDQYERDKQSFQRDGKLLIQKNSGSTTLTTTCLGLSGNRAHDRPMSVGMFILMAIATEKPHCSYNNPWAWWERFSCWILNAEGSNDPGCLNILLPRRRPPKLSILSICRIVYLRGAAVNISTHRFRINLVTARNNRKQVSPSRSLSISLVGDPTDEEGTFR